MADTPNYAAGSTTGVAGSRAGTASRRFIAASPSSTFLSLLSQGQPDSSESASSGATLNNTANSNLQTTAKNIVSQTFRLTSAGPETVSKRKKTSTETGTGAVALVTPPPDLSKAARWLLSLTSGQAPATDPSSSLSNSDLSAESSGTSSGEAAGATGSTQEDAAPAVPVLPFTAMPSRESETTVASGGVAQGTVDAVPFAELSLTPAATPTAANRTSTRQPDASSALPPPSFSARGPANSEVGAQTQSAGDSPATPGISSNGHTQGSQSSLDLSSNGSNDAPGQPKKKPESGSGPSEDFAMSTDRSVSGQAEVTSPTAPLTTEPQKASASPESPLATSAVPEPTNTGPAKAAGSSVGTIELQLRSGDDSSVGLRFVERQGHVEIQLKSGDQQTTQSLSDNLAGLKTSLNETGWDVQARVPPAGQTAQSAALDQHIRAATDQSGSSAQLPRTGEVIASQMNQQSGSDSSAGQDHSRPGRDDSSGRNGQQGRNDSANADSERQGRRSARESEAWLESMERNLTRS